MGNNAVRAGWFLDRNDPSLERYWDGEAWTEETRPSPSLNDFLGPIEPLLMEMIGLPKDNGQLDLDAVETIDAAEMTDEAAQPSDDNTSRVNRTTATS